MLHASVRAIGWIVGGPDTVLQALLDILTPEGTLMMYVGWEDSPYELAQWPEDRQRAYLEECPPFDPARSRAYRKWGILTEYFRTWPGARRSDHPDASFAADFISLHCAFTPERADLIGEKELRAMKPTTYLINTARGELVDEEALLVALREGWIAGAAMDAFKEEPATGSPLVRLDNFIATPHIGAATYESILRMGTLAVENALQVLRGERPPYVVNPEVYKESK